MGSTSSSPFTGLSCGEATTLGWYMLAAGKEGLLVRVMMEQLLNSLTIQLHHMETRSLSQLLVGLLVLEPREEGFQQGVVVVGTALRFHVDVLDAQQLAYLLQPGMADEPESWWFAKGVYPGVVALPEEVLKGVDGHFVVDVGGEMKGKNYLDFWNI